MAPARRPSAHARILEAADRLFSEQGIRAVGVEAIVAAADTAKTTLYAHFGSKDALVVAYLQRRAVQQHERLEQALATRRGSPVEQILHLYDVLAAELTEPGYRGSPFANACVELGGEHPTAAVAREHRRWLLDTFTGLAAAAATADPDALAAQLLLLYEGAATQVIGNGEAARTARTAAEGLLTAARLPTSERSVEGHPAGPSSSALAVRPPDARAMARNRVEGSREAHRLVAFLNSAHLPDGDDHLADDRADRWLRQWLADAGRPAPVGLDAPTELLALREGLRQLAGTNCGTPVDPAVVGLAEAVLEQSLLFVELAADGEPHVSAIDRDDTARLAIAVAADAYLAVQARGEWLRLKVCASPDCRWAFWDGTRNRSRRWCDMAGCGNRAKNRAWRSRRQTSVTMKII